MNRRSEGMTRKAYISYSRGADHTLKHRLREKQPPGWEICFDETALGTERSIEAFEDELSEADQVIFFLSRAYFQSYYCVSELLKIYAKRAKELLPVIVFVGKTRSGDITEAAVTAYWKHPDHKNRQPEHIKELPNALAWLLGRFNDTAGNWDTFFLVTDDHVGDPAPVVLAGLEADRKPRFSHMASAAKQTAIRKTVDDLLSGDRYDRLRDKVDAYLHGPPPTPHSVIGALDDLRRWLKDHRNAASSGREGRDMAADLRELCGYLVLSAVDDKKLHCCIHWLNRQREDACLRLKSGSDCAFQLVVSAIANCPALFRYHSPERLRQSTTKLTALMGEGELVLHERGLCERNYYDTFEEEARWLESYRALEQQMSASLGQPAGDYTELEDYSVAIEGLLGEQDGFYLLLEADKIRVTKSRRFRRRLARNFPKLPQVWELDEHTRPAEYHRAEDYFIAGLRIASITQKLISIYSELDRLTHDH